ncbi:MAG: hypothetical protein WAT17_00630 [Candidatus Saccharimonadales bacterium]|jgi:glucan phosphoethanolaminetransferase (alkaline phosphatase superfamily)
MMATFVIEIALMLWVLVRYRHTMIVKLIAIMMFSLAVFQLAEYNVCEGAFGLDSVTWARIGFVAITALPALGIHILTCIGKRPMIWLTALSYGAMLAFMAIYAFVEQGITNSVCGGNYVIIHTMPEANFWYGIYYYGLEIIAIAVSWWLSHRTKDKTIRRALYGMIGAYLVLLVPTTTVNLMYPYTVEGIPSIMCGFAVILALIVTFYVLPRVEHTKHLH